MVPWIYTKQRLRTCETGLCDISNYCKTAGRNYV